MTTLIFEGAGWPDADTSIISGVGNCRIRTHLRNDNGRVIYIEMSGNMHNGKNVPDYAKQFNVCGYVSYCFYADSDWDSQRCTSADFKFASHHFEFSPDGILQFVNDYLNCSFDSFEVVNDGSVYSHNQTKQPLCVSTEGYMTPYRDQSVNISVLDGIAQLNMYPMHRMAKYRLDYTFVKSVPFIAKWITERTQREQSQFPHNIYYLNVRWNLDGTITSAEISSNSNFANFGIGLDTLHDAVNHVVSSSQVVTV